MTDIDYSRIPPHDIQAEVCVIGAVMLRAADCVEAMKLLKPSHFYRPAHQVLWSVLTDMTDKGVGIDLVTVKAELEFRGQLPAVGGLDYVVAIVEGVPSSANSAYYAKIVYDRHRLRELIVLGNSLASNAFATFADPTALASEATTDLCQLLETGQVGRTQTAYAAAKEVLEQSERVQKDGVSPGLLLGIHGIDEKMEGLQPSDVCVVAGASSVGKTALALAFVRYAAGGGVACKVFSNEMSTAQVATRLLQAMSGVNGLKIRGGHQSAEDWGATSAALEELGRWGSGVEVTDEPMTVAQMLHETQAMQGRCGRMPGLVVIDYAQIVPGKGDLRERVTAVARGVKELAMRLSTAVVLLSQLSRDAAKQHRPPTKEELRETSELEQAANHVLLLYDPTDAGREAETAPEGGKVIWLRIAKGRDNATTPWEGPGRIRLAFFGPTTDYRELH